MQLNERDQATMDFYNLICNPAQLQADIEKERQERAAQTELPKLVGTEKQVKWANSIRADYVKLLQKAITETKGLIEKCHVENFQKKLAEVSSKLESKWWIENRFSLDHEKELLKDAIRYANRVKKELDAE